MGSLVAKASIEHTWPIAVLFHRRRDRLGGMLRLPACRMVFLGACSRPTRPFAKSASRMDRLTLGLTFLYLWRKSDQESPFLIG